METSDQKKSRAKRIFKILDSVFPHAKTALIHHNPFQLVVATLLSAQCTDVLVNKVTPALFARFPSPKAFFQADITDLEALVRPVNYYKTKTKNLKKMAAVLLEKYDGCVPNTLTELVTLPGVGRKTANVVLGQAFDIPGITVDTHVNRLSRRLGFTIHKEPHRIEQDLMKIWAPSIWIAFSSVLILHGRKTCKARFPQCKTCPLQTVCPKIGVLL